MPDAWTLARTRAATEYPIEGPVLDVGAGEFSDWFRPVFEGRGLIYRALDQRKLPGVDIVGCTDEMPPPTGVYGTVLLLSVLEHAKHPARLARWCADALKPGGYLLASAPICWAHHAYPDDYWRILPSGARLLLEDAGVSVLEIVTERERFDETNQWYAVARKS